MKDELVRPEELYSSMPHLTRVLDRGLDQVAAEREEAPHVPG